MSIRPPNTRVERCAALVKCRHAAHAGDHVRIAGVNRRAAGEQRMRLRPAAVVGQRTEQRRGVADEARLGRDRADNVIRRRVPRKFPDTIAWFTETLLKLGEIITPPPLPVPLLSASLRLAVMVLCLHDQVAEQRRRAAAIQPRQVAADRAIGDRHYVANAVLHEAAANVSGVARDRAGVNRRRRIPAIDAAAGAGAFRGVAANRALVNGHAAKMAIDAPPRPKSLNFR